MSVTEVRELSGGPQDGAMVKAVGDLPATIYVGPKWLGDGFAAWSRELSDRFPVRYDRTGPVFTHRPAS